jgi:hypothetical protein
MGEMYSGTVHEAPGRRSHRGLLRKRLDRATELSSSAIGSGCRQRKLSAWRMCREISGGGDSGEVHDFDEELDDLGGRPWRPWERARARAT